jgi:hypothetical protein
MAAAMISFLPQAPHELWQTAASPAILPSTWQSMYPKCPRCGGNAPNICDEEWPQNWWEDDMLGLMYQGHIPPSERTSPWETYYMHFRVPSLPPMTPQTPLRIQTVDYPYQYQTPGTGNPPMTPPLTPGVPRRTPYYAAPQHSTPPSPSSPYSRRTMDSRDASHSIYDDGTAVYIPDMRTFSTYPFSNF